MIINKLIFGIYTDPCSQTNLVTKLWSKICFSKVSVLYFLYFLSWPVQRKQWNSLCRNWDDPPPLSLSNQYGERKFMRSQNHKVQLTNPLTCIKYQRWQVIFIDETKMKGHLFSFFFSKKSNCTALPKQLFSGDTSTFFITDSTHLPISSQVPVMGFGICLNM